VNKLVLYTICIFFVIGGIDYILDNKFKIGEKFEEGIKAMGPLAMAMVGIYSFIPMMSKLISIFLNPLAHLIKIDPSIIPSSLLATDMGAFQLSKILSASNEMSLFSGVILASNLGAAISFSIPLAMSIISKEDYKYYAKGVIAGLITIPFGAFIGGMLQGINYFVLIWNLTPIIVLALLCSTGLLYFSKISLKIITMFGKGIFYLSIFGLILQGINSITGYEYIKGLTPINESISIVGKISIVLAGAYPMIMILNKVFNSIFTKLGKYIGVNEEAVCGILGNLASNLLVYMTFTKMNNKGKVVASAVSISSSFVLGGQLGFISNVAPKMIVPFIASKLSAGILSIVIACYIYDLESNKVKVKSVDNLNYEG
jgi:ethanolamine transporter